MLPKALRLTSPNDFDRLYKQGNRIYTRELRLTFLPNNQNLSRFGFVVSKKQAGKIVERNKIKRILRSHVYKRIQNFPKGFDFIIQPKSTIAKADTAEVYKEFDELLKKLEAKLKK